MIKEFEKICSKAECGAVEDNSGGIITLNAPGLLRTGGIKHGFTSRIGGISPKPFDSLNFSFNRADDPENVRKNYRILAEKRGLDYDKLVLVNHEHGCKVLRVSKKEAGRGLTREKLPFSDGLITDDPEITLVTGHADCGSIYLYDRKKHAIGLAHAGWKGALLRMAQRLAESMMKEFSSDPSDMVAALGPCICFDCFEVDSSLGEKFKAEFGQSSIVKEGRPGKAYVDIESVLLLQLLEAGIRPENISLMHRCTYEEKELFYSYRRDGAGTGAMSAYMKLEK